MERAEKENMVKFKVDRKIYPLEVIFGACFSFIDRCYVYLDRDGKDMISVTLKGKTKLSKAELEALGGEFNNELLNQALRKKISQTNKRIREYIVSRALFSAEPVEEVEPEFEEPFEDNLDFEKDFLDDPLQIAVPWDEKYGDGKSGGQTAATAPAGPGGDSNQDGKPGGEAE